MGKRGCCGGEPAEPAEPAAVDSRRAAEAASGGDEGMKRKKEKKKKTRKRRNTRVRLRVKGVINFAVSILAFAVYDSFAHRYLNKRVFSVLVYFLRRRDLFWRIRALVCLCL